MYRICALMIAIACVCLSACSKGPGKSDFQPRDPRMVGTWMVLEPESRADPDPLHRGEKTYFQDGSACGYNLDWQDDGSAKLGVFRSRWEIKSGQLISTVLASNVSYLRPGTVFVDDILSLRPLVLRLHDTNGPDGSSYSRYKSPVDQGMRLCQLFDTVMRNSRTSNGRSGQAPIR